MEDVAIRPDSQLPLLLARAGAGERLELEALEAAGVQQHAARLTATGGPLKGFPTYGPPPAKAKAKAAATPKKPAAGAVRPEPGAKPPSVGGSKPGTAQGSRPSTRGSRPVSREQQFSGAPATKADDWKREKQVK